MKPLFNRIFAYPKDIQIITGKGGRYARTMYRKIKIYYKKDDHQLLTIEELEGYFGLPPNSLGEILPN